MSTRWLAYNFIAAFSLYWVSNLILWFPWSYSNWLGIAMMLSISPLIWAFGIYLCLVRFPGKRLINAAAVNASILLLVAIPMDYVFFGLIRDAMEQLYHPTTFYGYAFLIILPFLMVLILPKRIRRKKQTIQQKDLVKMSLPGTISLLLIILIIIRDISL